MYTDDPFTYGRACWIVSGSRIRCHLSLGKSTLAKTELWTFYTRSAISFNFNFVQLSDHEARDVALKLEKAD